MSRFFWWIYRCIPKTLLRHHSTHNFGSFLNFLIFDVFHNQNLLNGIFNLKNFTFTGKSFKFVLDHQGCGGKRGGWRETLHFRRGNWRGRVLSGKKAPETLSFGRANFTCTNLKVKTDFFVPSPPHSIPPAVISCKMFNLSVFHPLSSLFHKIDEQGGFSNSSLVIKGVKA